MLRLLKTLCGADAPSGFETPVIKNLSELTRPLADEISVDVMGNLTAVRYADKKPQNTKSRGGVSPDNHGDTREQPPKKLMLCAHADEVGLIVTGHDKGFLRFAALGGVDARILPASVVKILVSPENNAGTKNDVGKQPNESGINSENAGKPLYGVIGVMPPHTMSSDEADKSLGIDELYIDTGLSGEEAERLIPPGTPAVLESRLVRLGAEAVNNEFLFTLSENSLSENRDNGGADGKNYGGSYSSKALDDRACCALIVKLFEALKDTRLDFELIALFSAQEELGLRGAKTAAAAVSPDLAVVLDVTFAETPDTKPGETMKFNGGAAIGIGPNVRRDLSDRLISIAKANGIPYQPEILPGSSGTDGWVIQTSGTGIPTALISLPVKYMHTPIETLGAEDFESCLKLLTEFIKNAGEVL